MDTINIFEELENNKEELELILTKNTTINILNQKFKNINLTILDNIEVIINEFNNNNTEKANITFSIHSNSLLTYNLSNIINNNYNLSINIEYKGNNSKVLTNIHSLVKGNEKIIIKGQVENAYKNNELLENVKVLLINDGTCEVNPDMLIDTKEVIANHKVAISPLRNTELFYLMSKGITKVSAEKLLKTSFLISNIDDNELKEKINVLI